MNSRFLHQRTMPQGSWVLNTYQCGDRTDPNEAKNFPVAVNYKRVSKCRFSGDSAASFPDREGILRRQ